MNGSARERIAAARGESLRFAVHARPTPKARARVVSGHAYTPQRTRSFEDLVGWAAKEAMLHSRWQLTDGPVLVDLTIIAAPARVDGDNVLKSVLDALNGIVYLDDHQVQGTAVWRLAQGAPGVVIEVVALGAGG